ncbi:MAG TPA: transcriptional regulator [Pirellulaceae bacterium]|nr:transcriptional regulator [Pirellulaceae bacterium]HMO91211.1 transcriptional regulator [Pirellulaceae bacterium]HMP70794.1 transcriptional regulator [Pirellulaceae bacterium]
MQTNRNELVDHDALPGEVNELANLISTLPAEYQHRLLPSVQRVVEMTKRRRRILSLVQEALGQLRLDMKYLMFDLEATRRERDKYRTALDDSSDENFG